jgi:hypothetical protein
MVPAVPAADTLRVRIPAPAGARKTPAARPTPAVTDTADTEAAAGQAGKADKEPLRFQAAGEAEGKVDSADMVGRVAWLISLIS